MKRFYADRAKLIGPKNVSNNDERPDERAEGSLLGELADVSDSPENISLRLLLHAC